MSTLSGTVETIIYSYDVCSSSSSTPAGLENGPFVQWRLTWKLKGESVLCGFLKENNDSIVAEVILRYFMTARRLELTEWYNVLKTSYNSSQIATEEEKGLTKGLMSKSLLYLLDIIKFKSPVIYLKSLPNMGSKIYKDPFTLVAYYKKLGFKQTDETQTSSVVNMSAEVSTLRENMAESADVCKTDFNGIINHAISTGTLY